MLRGLAILCCVLLPLGVAESKSTRQRSYHPNHPPHPKHYKHGRQIQPDTKRVTEIQVALSQEGYRTSITGRWDDQTKQAMRAYQVDHGLQEKVVPDAKALILLGLGPEYYGLINPNTAAINKP